MTVIAAQSFRSHLGYERTGKTADAHLHPPVALQNAHEFFFGVSDLAFPMPASCGKSVGASH